MAACAGWLRVLDLIRSVSCFNVGYLFWSDLCSSSVIACIDSFTGLFTGSKPKLSVVNSLGTLELLKPPPKTCLDLTKFLS